MIRPLRSRHRIMIVAVAIVVPVVFAAGLLARKPAPRVPGFPVILTPPSAAVGDSVAGPRVTNLDDGGLLAVTLVGSPESVSGLAVVVDIDVHRGRPEWLAYWTPADTVGETLPDDAWLLGALSDAGTNILELPEPAAAGGGRLVVYVPVDDRVLASQPLPDAAGGTDAGPDGLMP